MIEGKMNYSHATGGIYDKEYVATHTIGFDKVKGSVPKVKVTHMHSICQYCDNPHCIPACPEQAISNEK